MRKKFLLPVNECNNEKHLMIGSYRGQLNTMCNIEWHLRRRKSRGQKRNICLKHTLLRFAHIVGAYFRNLNQSNKLLL